MRLRPATPLSVVLFAAFALMLLSVLSAPVISAIPLGKFRDTTYGVFGKCDGSSCTGIGIGYDLDSAQDRNFDMPSGVRSSLPSILILHPVAAFFCLLMFILAVTSHFHAPAHSVRFLLIFFILLMFTCLLCVASFIVDVLLFLPHMAWGTYVVLAAAIICAFSGVVTCAMRRTMVSRKARRREIQENAEMSGENFYNREAKTQPDVGISNQPAIPLMTGTNQSSSNGMATFASFDQSKKEDQVSESQIPLTQKSPSLTNVGPAPTTAGGYGSRSPPRDPYGNPIKGSSDGYGFERSQSRGRGDMAGAFHRGRGGPQRGRGGYGPPGRGRGGYGGPPGRGGYGPPGRGAYGPRGGRGGYGPPPRGGYGPGPGPDGPMRGGRSPPPMYGGYGATRYQDAPPRQNDAYAQDYSANQSTNPSSSAIDNYDAYNPDANLARAESPPPLPGQASSTQEADRSQQNGVGYGQYGPLRDSDVDVAGMVGLQQGQTLGPSRHDTYMSEGSKYSTDEQYVPPRANWNGASGRNSPAAPSPLNIQTRASPTQMSDRGTPSSNERKPPGAYYEDIDPRFAEPSPSHIAPQAEPRYDGPPHPHVQNHPAEPMYEDPHAGDGARSPAESEKSTFTSISQRGVNPRWQPPPPMPGQGLRPPPQQQRRPQQQRQDMILDNPDFQLPGAGNRQQGPRGVGGGMIPGSAYPTGGI